jgi:hypothetical protein
MLGMTIKYSLNEAFVARVVQFPGRALNQAARCIIDCTARSSTDGSHEDTSAFLRSDHVHSRQT